MQDPAGPAELETFVIRKAGVNMLSSGTAEIVY